MYLLSKLIGHVQPTTSINTQNANGEITSPGSIQSKDLRKKFSLPDPENSESVAQLLRHQAEASGDSFIVTDIQNPLLKKGAIAQRGGRQKNKGLQDLWGSLRLRNSLKAQSSKPKPALNNLLQESRSVSVDALLSSGLNFSQGRVGDCYMLASLYAILQNPKALALLKTSKLEETVDLDGSVQKSRFIFPTGLKADVEPAELIKGTESVKAPEIIQIMERVYAKGVRKYRNDQRIIPYPNDGAGHTLKLVRGGHASFALLNMLGGKKVYHSLENSTDLRAFLNEIKQDQDSNYVLTIGTPSSSDGQRGSITHTLSTGEKIRLPLRHAYSLLLDKESDKVTIVDPHDTSTKRYSIDVEELPKLFSSIEGIKLPAGPYTPQ